VFGVSLNVLGVSGLLSSLRFRVCAKNVENIFAQPFVVCSEDSLDEWMGCDRMER